MNKGRRQVRAVLPALLAALVTVAACTNAPPPQLVERPPSESPTTSTPTTRPKLTEVTVGVDDLEGGFNPHSLADLSPTSSALASLMLPSVFRPGPGGELQLDRTLMESAEVVEDAEKFTVRYEIRKEAGWSDGAPIAAEDFVYLWEQLRSQPGASDPVGYQLIEDVASRQGGKTVEVTFSQPYEGWRTLFTNLLPAHLVKDAPGGWTEALDGGYPASGGPFAIRQFDLERGEIVLERNDRYWGEPAVSDRVVLRSNDRARQVESLRSGDTHVAVFSADDETMDALRDLGDSVRVKTVPRPATMQLLLRPSSPSLTDVRVRNAVASALNREDLTAAGTQGGPADQLPAHAQVLAPSETGYTPTEPPGAFPGEPDGAEVARLLNEAGYQRSGGAWVRDGRPLSLVIAAPFDNEQYIRIAEETADQLRQQGIRANVITPTGDQLFGEMLPANPRTENPGANSVDIAVAPRPAGGDPATMLAASFGCPKTDEDGDQPFPYTPTGFCDPLLQPTIDAALSGAISFDDASERVEPVVWSQAVALPLYQQAQVMVVRRGMTGVQPGFGFAGPFSTTDRWLGSPTDDDGY